MADLSGRHMDPGAPSRPAGRGGLRADHPQDGRGHGGNLSFPAEPTYRPTEAEARLSTAFDVAQQTLSVTSNPGWVSQLAVGKLLSESRSVEDPRTTAEGLGSCIVTGAATSTRCWTGRSPPSRRSSPPRPPAR